MTDPISSEDSVSQMDYLKLFMQELTYQDPLKPVDNKEFMAQMAQFSSLQEARTTNDRLLTLLGMSSGTQSLGLLGKTVKVIDSDKLGEVTQVSFAESEPPKLTIRYSGESPITVNIGQISGVES